MMNTNKHNDDQTELWMNVLSSIGELLDSEVVAMWLEDIQVNFSTGRVTLVTSNDFREDIIRRRLQPYVEHALREQGVEGIVEITSKIPEEQNPCGKNNDAEFVDQVMKILRDYKYLGHVSTCGSNYVLVTSSKGDVECNISIFQVDTTGLETYTQLDPYCFSIVDGDTYLEVLNEFGRNCLLDASGGV